MPFSTEVLVESGHVSNTRKAVTQCKSIARGVVHGFEYMHIYIYIYLFIFIDRWKFNNVATEPFPLDSPLSA